MQVVHSRDAAWFTMHCFKHEDRGEPIVRLTSASRRTVFQILPWILDAFTFDR